MLISLAGGLTLSNRFEVSDEKDAHERLDHCGKLLEKSPRLYTSLSSFAYDQGAAVFGALAGAVGAEVVQEEDERRRRERGEPNNSSSRAENTLVLGFIFTFCCIFTNKIKAPIWTKKTFLSQKGLDFR